MDAAGVGVFAGHAEVAGVIHLGHVVGGVEALHGFRRGGDEFLLALGEALQRAFEGGVFPFLLVLADFFNGFGVIEGHGSVSLEDRMG